MAAVAIEARTIVTADDMEAAAATVTEIRVVVRPVTTGRLDVPVIEIAGMTGIAHSLRPRLIGGVVVGPRRAVSVGAAEDLLLHRCTATDRIHLIAVGRQDLRDH